MIEAKFKELCHAYLRIKGEELVIPDAMRNDFLLWREAWQRHRLGDFRYRESEKIATRNVAQWTVDINRKIRNQEPQTIEWGD